MNILPLIFTFLIIFTCLACTFLREVKSFFLTEQVFHSFYRTEKQLNNAMVRKSYRKIEGESKDKKKAQEGKKTKLSTYLSRRSFFPPFENSKFNIKPLIQHPGEYRLHPLFEPLAELLRLLYKPIFLDEKSHSNSLEYQLLEAILHQARKHPQAKDLIELCPEDPTLQKIYYQLLKGTNQYLQKASIPPLEDFLALKKGSTAVYLSFASPMILQAFFGSEIAEHILKEERNKAKTLNQYYYFSKKDMEALLMNHPSLSLKYPSFDPYLGDSKKFDSRLEIGGIDPHTGLSIKKPISIPSSSKALKKN